MPPVAVCSSRFLLSNNLRVGDWLRVTRSARTVLALVTLGENSEAQLLPAQECVLLFGEDHFAFPQQNGTAEDYFEKVESVENAVLIIARIIKPLPSSENELLDTSTAAKLHLLGHVVIEGSTSSILEVVGIMPRNRRVLVTHSTHICIVPEASLTPNPSDRRDNLFHSYLSQFPGGAYAKALLALQEMVLLPLQYASMFSALNIEPPKAILMSGPPGVGKTTIALAIAHACHAEMKIIRGPEIYGPEAGESEARLRAAFASLQNKEKPGFKTKCPRFLFIDELDALCPPRDSSDSQASRMVAQLLTLMDGMLSRENVVVLATTNRPNSIDAALRRPGRFDREVVIDPPDRDERVFFLKFLTKNWPLACDVDFYQLSESLIGYVQADLASLVGEAAILASRDAESSSALPIVYQKHFVAALNLKVPSLKRQLVQVSERRDWGDIGGLDDVKLKLQQCIEWPLKHAHTFLKLGLKPPRGVLLHGPPGCSKTTLVRATASTSKATFVCLSGGQIYSPFVGDAEKAVRDAFRAAKNSTPAIIFLDEIDAIVGRRGSGGGNGGQDNDVVKERVVATLLNEMDGVESADGILVVGATNRVDMIDTALLRPGRFDRVLYVPPPDQKSREQILQIHVRKLPLSNDVDVKILAEKTEFYSGADLESLCREAALTSLRESLASERVTSGHFDSALKVVPPSLSPSMLLGYVIHESALTER